VPTENRDSKNICERETPEPCRKQGEEKPTLIRLCR